MGLNVGYLKADKSAKGDECYTPFYAVDPILKYLDKSKVIWLPFDEDWSAFNVTLRRCGYKVINSNLKNSQDFFTYTPEHFDVIISNPPFSLKDQVLKRLYELGKPFAIILPLNSIQGKSRYKYFKQGIQLLCFDKRICYHMDSNFNEYQKGTAFASAYFCRNLLPNDFIIEELNEYQKPLKEGLNEKKA